jgi:histidinol-phosphate aminotransferase
MRELVREHIKALVPYQSARSEFDGEADVYLDANENPYDFTFNRYPDPYQRNLKKRLADIRGWEVEQLFLGNGSDEIIDLLIRTYCEPHKDAILTCKPGFSMYQVSAGICQVRHDEFELTADFEINIESFIKAIKPEHKIIFICSPNNPTGNAIPNKTIAQIVDAAPGLVVVDEAYVDFTENGSCLKEINNRKLVVLQTFSKSFGSAGIRLGVGIMDKEIVSFLNVVKLPYNVSESTQAHATQLLNNYNKVIDSVLTIKKERDKVVEQLKNLDSVLHVYPSDANFLLVKFDDAKKVYDYLKNNGVIVRDRSTLLHCEGCLRITIGLPKENDRLLTLLKTFGK